MVLMELNVLRVKLMPVKIMPITDATVASQVLRAGICSDLPADSIVGILDDHPLLSEILGPIYSSLGRVYRWSGSSSRRIRSSSAVGGFVC